MITPLYDPANGVMRVVGLMSGKGSNIRTLLKRQKELGDKVYQFVALFTDKPESNALAIGKEFSVPVVVKDIAEFYCKRNLPKSDLSVRAEFEEEALKELRIYDAPVAAYGGYMSVASPLLVNAFLGINVHPADLSIRDPKNSKMPKYTGAHAVSKAMRAGETYLRASTHVIATSVDCGQILMISQPVEVNRDETPDQNQDRLKEKGDLLIFPKTLEFLAQGRFARGGVCEMLYLDGEPKIYGAKWEDIK